MPTGAAPTQFKKCCEGDIGGGIRFCFGGKKPAQLDAAMGVGRWYLGSWRLPYTWLFISRSKTRSPSHLRTQIIGLAYFPAT